MLKLGRRHVDLRAQHVRPVGKLVGAHPREQVEILFDRSNRGAGCSAGLVSVPR